MKVNSAHGYLGRFRKALAHWNGSLVRVGHISMPNAREYLSRLARHGLVERVTWGWYWVPDDVQDFWDFLVRDRNFKVVAGQSAASIWNNDFIHRDTYLVKVADASYGRALVAFAGSRGWRVVVEPLKPDAAYRKVGGIYVESMEDCVVESIRHWAFADAFAVLYQHRALFQKVADKGYWSRIAKSGVRIRQALTYGATRFNELSPAPVFPVTRRTTLEDSFVREQIDEAVEKVLELG